MLTSIQYMYNFTETGHGKGEHDGANTCIKRALAHEELKYKDGETFLDVISIIEWCHATMDPSNEGESMVHIFFWLINEINIAPYADCCIMTGSSELLF